MTTWNNDNEAFTSGKFGTIDYSKLPELAKAIGDYIEAQRMEGVSI